MIINENDDQLAGILRTAEKHPNSNVSKLIQETQRVPTVRNIVLLLIEIAQNVEYANNFDISLQYYINLYDHLTQVQNDYSLNEAGMLLESAAKIYDRRVDVIHDLVHAQLSSLRESINENAQQTEVETPKPAVAEKSKRTRKRVVENVKEPWDVQMELRKFRKLSTEKRFVQPAPEMEQLQRLAVINKQCHQSKADEMDLIHPKAGLHSIIPDLDKEGELDTKRYFKLFMHHVEHRYNTLVPDISFRLHFLVKDFIDEEQERTDDETSQVAGNRSWPPLSRAYVEKYVNLENQVLRLEHNLLCENVESPAVLQTRETSPEILSNVMAVDSGYLSSTLLSGDQSSLINRMSINSTGTGISLIEKTANLTDGISAMDTSETNVTANEKEDTANSSDTEGNKENLMDLIEKRIEKFMLNSSNAMLNFCKNVDLSKVRVSLPNMKDGSVSYTELDVETQKILSPVEKVDNILGGVIGTENLGGLLEKNVDELLGVLDLLELNNDDMQMLNDVVSTSKLQPPCKSQTEIILNIMKFDNKLLRRQALFKLGSEMNIFLQARSLKRPRKTNADDTQRPSKLRIEELRRTPAFSDHNSLDGEDFLGFADTESNFGDFVGFKFADKKEEDESFQFFKHKLKQLENVHHDKESSVQEDQGISMSCDETTIHPTTTDNTANIGNEPTEDNCDARSENNDSCEENEVQTSTIDAELQRIENTSCDKMTNVQEWHYNLRDRLSTAREHHHFDVFDIGTEIMDSLQAAQTNDIEKGFTFADAMEGKNKGYVSRYYLSLLLLLNQGNIEVQVKNQNSDKPSEWSDLQLKLLSTKRHTVSIEDNVGMIPNKNNDGDVANAMNKGKHARRNSNNFHISKKMKYPTDTNVLSSTLAVEGASESFTSLDISELTMPSCTTILHSSYEHVKINMDTIKPVKQVYKKLPSSDDHDSGFYTASLNSNNTDNNSMA